MGPPSAAAAVVASRIAGVVVLELTVQSSTWVAPSLRELHLVGDLAAFHPLPGQDLMVSVVDAAGGHRWRRYTVRSHTDAGCVLWVTTDSDGPGAAWAHLAEPGDAVEAVGPRGKISVDATAAAHVFVVDEAGLAAACAMAESLAAPSFVHVASPHHGDHAVRPAVADGVVLTTSELPRSSTASIDLDQLGADLAAAVGAPGWPSAHATAGYVFAELRLSRSVPALLERAGVGLDRVASKPYWRADRANAEHGEPDRD